MASSIKSVFAAAGLEPVGSVRWGDRIPAPPTGLTTGVYAVSSADDPGACRTSGQPCPVSQQALTTLLDARPELRLDRKRPDARALGKRIGGFWLAEESILYLGLAGPRSKRAKNGELPERVHDYYRTKLGARSPHAGGWFLKMLANLDKLYVHYAYCDHVNEVEQKMLEAFADGVAEETRERLVDSESVMPFANLEFPPGNRKRHGVTGATAPRSRKPRQRPQIAKPAPVPTRAKSPTSRQLDTSVTQIITEGDLSSGIVRVPKASKRLFPKAKGRIDVELRGEELGARRWDPRVGPDQERSGVIGIGKAAAGRLRSGEQLVVERMQTGVRMK
ncbi:MAG: hypothetical protein ACR2NA_07095 [Solirubrobacterales bacterium]